MANSIITAITLGIELPPIASLPLASSIYRAELELSQLLAEFSSPATDPDRREELRKEIGESVRVLTKRNKMKSAEQIRENLRRVALALEEKALAEKGTSAAAEEPSVPAEHPETPPQENA